MRKIIHFSKYFIPTGILSLVLMGLGIGGYLAKGFNLGVDFKVGLLQEIQLAPVAFGLTYDGPGNASISLSRTSLDIVISGAGIDEQTNRFAFSSYTTQAELVGALRGVDGLGVTDAANAGAQSAWLIQSAQSSPLLDVSTPFVVHYLTPDAKPVRIEEVRSSLLPLGTVSVQVLGESAERRFMIRMEDSELSGDSRSVPADKIISALENTFGQGEVAVTRTDYVGSRFSKQLTDQAGFLTIGTLLLIMAYCSIRFKIQYATGAVLAIIHDAIVMIAFIVWFRMEFNTTTIAALLTILGYSINDKVVVFDRMKETRRIFPDDAYVDVLDRALTETTSRTIITTLTTLLAVVSLYIFTTGSMKDFALALMVGMISGVYSTFFIAASFVNIWEKISAKRDKNKLAPAPSKA